MGIMGAQPMSPYSKNRDRARPETPHGDACARISLDYRVVIPFTAASLPALAASASCFPAQNNQGLQVPTD
jgi:hypothetical protein